MNRLLEKAIAAVSELPEEEQDAFAKRMLQEIGWEANWDSAFEKNPDKLDRLFEGAKGDIESGRVSELRPDDL